MSTKKGFIMIPNEVFDNLDEAGVYTYAWLVRNSVIEDGRRIVKTSYRDIASEWGCSYVTVFRAVSKLEDFVSIKRGKNQYEPTIIEIHDVTAKVTKRVTPNVTPNVTAPVTPKKSSKPLVTKGIQSPNLFDGVTPNVTPKTEGYVTPNVTAPVTAPRAYKNDNIIISCLKKINTEKEYSYYITALERIGESVDSMSDKSDAEAQRLVVKFVEQYYNLMVEVNGARMSKIKAGIANQRLSFLKARIGEQGLLNVLEVIDKATQSNFLNGGGDRAFVASFEWIMRPNNFPKVLEGYYDNRQKQNTQGNGYRTNDSTYEERRQGAERLVARLLAENERERMAQSQRHDGAVQP